MRKSIRTSGKAARFYVLFILLFMYLPVIVLVIFSFNNSKTSVWAGFTLDWYKRLFHNVQIRDALGTSARLALYSCLSAAVIGTLGAFGMSRSHFKGKGILENTALFPIMIPEIIIALAYLVFFARVGIPFGMKALVLAHTTFCIPYVYINVKSRLAGMDVSIQEAALDLGASKPRMFIDIVVPLVMPAILSGSLLALAMSLDDVIISLFLTDATTTTLPIRIYSMMKTGVTPEINALCTVLLAVVLIAFGVFSMVRVQTKKRT